MLLIRTSSGLTLAFEGEFAKKEESLDRIKLIPSSALQNGQALSNRQCCWNETFTFNLVVGDSNFLTRILSSGSVNKFDLLYAKRSAEQILLFQSSAHPTEQQADERHLSTSKATSKA